MKKNLILLLICFVITPLCSQSKQEFSVGIAGGESYLSYNTVYGKIQEKIGGNINLGYSYTVSEFAAIGTGMEATLYRSGVNMNDIYTKTFVLDKDNKEFEFKSTIKNYKESQDALYLNIPFMLQAFTGNRNKLYLGTGIKLGIPLQLKSKIRKAEIINSGYYASENIEFTTPKEMGFGTFTNMASDLDLKLKIAYIFSFETGIKYELQKNRSIYFILYIDYGLNDVNNNDTSPNLVEYNTQNPENFVINSIFNSSYAVGKNQYAFIDSKIMPMALGLKIKLAFGK